LFRAQSYPGRAAGAIAHIEAHLEAFSDDVIAIALTLKKGLSIELKLPTAEHFTNTIDL